MAKGSAAVHGSLVAGGEVWLLYSISENLILKITLDLSFVCFENKGFKNCDLWVFKQPVNWTFLKSIPKRDQLIKGCPIYLNLYAYLGMNKDS